MNGFLKIILIVFLLFSPSVVLKSQIVSEQKQKIKIIRGDNLWNIARRVYGSGLEFQKVWDGRLDSTISKDPNLVYPNMEFYIESRKINVVKIPTTDNYSDFKNDIVKIRDATLSIDENVKLLPEKLNTPDYKDFWSYLFIIGTGFIVSVLSFLLIPKKKNE
jgi:hypothetical protein